MSPAISQNFTQAVKRRHASDDEGEKSLQKPAKQRKSKKSESNDDAHLNEFSNINSALGKMDNRLLTDLVASKTKRFLPNLSLVELEDLHVPGEKGRFL